MKRFAFILILLAAAEFVFGQQYQQNTRKNYKTLDIPGLIGWWKLDETSGTVAKDSSGSGKDGTLYNTPTWVSGSRNNALDFNGTSQYVSMGDVLDLGTTNFSVVFWAKPANLIAEQREASVISKQVQYNTAGWSIVTSTWGTLGSDTSYVLQMYINVSEYPILATDYMEVSIWNHFCFLREGTTIRVYVNGVYYSEATADQVDDDVSNTATLNIAQNKVNSGWYYFPGTIDDVRIYNRALTAEEVQTIYNYP